MKIHLIGIGGTGMGALAGLLVEAGHEVRGSDGPLYPPMSTLLEELHIPLYQGYRPENLDWVPDRVVVGNICRKDHPEAVAAQERELQLTSFPALLSDLFLQSRHSIVVAGTHGKTTTTSLLSHLLHAAGLSPGFLVGGIPQNFNRSFALGQPPYFVIEGDEYDTAFFDKRPKFVHYQPRTVILTGVEFDHADIYPSMADVERAFSMLIERVPAAGRIVVCADSPVAVRLCQQAACKVESYSIHIDADWRGSLSESVPGTAQTRWLSVHYKGQNLGQFPIRLTGHHNVSNILATLAVAHGLGISSSNLSEGLTNFAGVRRRQEVRGKIAGVTVIDDFAHHPTAIRETLAGLRGIHGSGKLIAVFEPRSATSRRKVFQREFAEALKEADYTIITKLFAPENIPLAERLDPAQIARDLQSANREAAYLESVEEIENQLASTCRSGDTVVVMSSGSFGGLIEKLLQRLAEG